MQFKSNKEIQVTNLNDISDINILSKTICIFDIEYERAVEIETNSTFFNNFQGFSQLNFINSLYFCGACSSDKTNGSYFLKYEPNKPTKNVTFLINSIQHHFFPSMIGFKNEQIFVIGGLHTKSAEYYNLRTHRWRNLPDIDQERFNCMGLADENNDMIYIFGGYNYELNTNNSTILRLNLKSFHVWETLAVKSNSNLISKNSSAIFKFEKDECIYIIGGRDNLRNTTNDIIEYDILQNDLVLVGKKLDIPCSFSQSGGNDLNKNEFFFIDDAFNVHKICRNDFKIKMYRYEDIASYCDG